MPECFFKHLGGCDGRLVKAHLIPKQRIKREIASRFLGGLTRDEFDKIVWDQRVWVWMCGGSNYGAEGHHGQFDNPNHPLKLNYSEIPTCTKEFAKEYGLEWSLERDYER